MNETYALRLKEIKKGFNGVGVLHGINLEIPAGQVLGLVGENGAGKSTMMNIIGGILPSDSGEMEIFGEAYKPASPQDAMHRGIAFVHQELNLFTNLTVAENMFIEDYPCKAFGLIDYKKIEEETQNAIEQYDLDVKPTTKMDTLTTGVCQLIEISKGLMKNAKIMIFDEPTTSLSHKEKEKLFATIDELKKQGMTIIYISHILEDVLSMCDSIAVLRDGFIISHKPVQEVTQEQMIADMVGRAITQIYPTVEKKIFDEVALEAENVCCANGKVKNISASVRKGEILGFYGLMGSGRTEFVRACYGLDPMESGTVKIHGEIIEKPTPAKCIEKGVAFVTEDRHNEGLVLTKPVYDNVVLVKLKHILSRFNMVDRKKEKQCVDEAIKNLNIKVADPRRQTADSLSGGNQQKVVLGKWVATNPSVFILDEPTRGVDVGAKYEIYTIIQRMAKNGTAVITISSEMEELMGICDRIIVIKEGQVAGELSRNEFSQEAVIKLAL